MTGRGATGARVMGFAGRKAGMGRATARGPAGMMGRATGREVVVGGLMPTVVQGAPGIACVLSSSVPARTTSENGRRDAPSPAQAVQSTPRTP